MAETHKHILVTGYYNQAPAKDAIDYINQWFERLVEKVGMNVLMGPYAVWCETTGNEGLTAIVGIDTSHSSIHCWPDYFKFDLYSCKDFTLESVVEMLSMLDAYRLTYTIVDRSDDSHPIIESGEIEIK